MKTKTSLHIHTKEDKRDGHMIKYDVFQLIDEAVKHDFKVLGYTPHKKFVFKKEYAEYARSKGVLLIPGVERSMGRITNSHVIILNCDKSIEKVKNFKQLIAYKKQHPEIFIIAPHPTYSRLLSVGKRNLRKYIELFDAIEYSWLYSKRINSNRKAEAIAKEFDKPMISTSDVHNLNKLDLDYAVLDVDYLQAESVFAAIRENRFENITAPKKILQIYSHIISSIASYAYNFLKIKILFLKPREIPIIEND